MVINVNTVNHVAEDWDGLKAMLEQSNMAQKDAVIRIVESNNGDARDHEMRMNKDMFRNHCLSILKEKRSRLNFN